MIELQTSNVKIQNKSQSGNGENPKVFDLRERLLLFARRILQLCKMLPMIPECERIRKQLASAATSIGANFEEADGALTRKDFVNKAGIARKEAKETRFWLRAISDVYIERNEVVADIQESEEIICILSSMLRKAGFNRRA